MYVEGKRNGTSTPHDDLSVACVPTFMPGRTDKGCVGELALPAAAPLCCAFCFVFGAAVMYAPMAHTPLTAGKDHGRDVEHGAGMWAPNNAVAAMEASVRTGFLRKVFGLVACQLALTAAVSAIFMYNHAIRHFVLHAPSLTMVSFFVSLGFLFGAHLNKDSHPTNLYMLLGFTLSIAWSVGVTCAMYASAGYGFLVLEAVGITASVTAGLSLYTLRSKQDFSYLGASLGSALWVLILGGLVASLTGAAAMHTALAVGGAMIFSLYIVYDVQEIAKRMSPDEYVSAAISLYLVRAFRRRPPCRVAWPFCCCCCCGDANGWVARCSADSSRRISSISSSTSCASSLRCSRGTERVRVKSGWSRRRRPPR